MLRNGQSGRIVRERDGSSTGCYGPFLLKTALQPIFGRSGTGGIAVRGVEALLRISRDGVQHPTADFLSRIGHHQRRTLDAHCRSLHLANASLESDSNLLLFLNVNPAVYSNKLTLLSEIEELSRIVRKSRFTNNRIICEITEDSTSKPDLLKLLVDTLRADDFRVAVDDFGTESSDTGRVSFVHPDFVKLDGRWTTRLMATQPGYALLRDSVKRFQDEGIAVVIEGLEHHWQVELGWGTEADYIQGYGLARPQIAPTAFSASVQVS